MGTSTPHQRTMHTTTKDPARPVGPLRRLMNRVGGALFADDEASLRYATVDAELDGRFGDALRYSIDHDEFVEGKRR